MGRNRRTTFAKLQRERARQAKQAEKRERRQARRASEQRVDRPNPEGPEAGTETDRTLDTRVIGLQQDSTRRKATGSSGLVDESSDN